jgi:hypothetical protein
VALTSILFLLAFAAGLSLCIFRGPVWGLYVYLAVFYLDPPSRWWGQSLPDLRWSLLAALITLICVFLQKRNSPRAPFAAHALTWIFAFYVIWMWVQTPFVVSVEHLDGAILFTKYLVLLYIIYEIVDTPEKVRDFLLAHIAGCLYLGWLAFSATGGGRLEGVGGPGIDDANTMSMHFGTAVAAGAMLLMTERGWRFWFVLVAMPFMLNGIILGNSRGAVLGLLAGGLMLFRLRPAAYRKQFLVFGALGGVLLLYLAHDAFWDRLFSLSAVTGAEQELDFSASSRVDILAAQWRMFLDHPFGAGHGGTETLSTKYLSAEYMAVETGTRSSHNTFMSVVVDQGVPGICLLLALLFWVWRTVRFAARKGQTDSRAWGYSAAVAGALAVAVVAGQFSPYLKAEVQYWCLGLLMTLASLAKLHEPQSIRAANGRVRSTRSRAKITPLADAKPLDESGMRRADR